MKAILILAHGSKRQETESTMESLVEKVKKRTGEENVFPAYLQLNEPSLETVIEALAQKGFKTINLVPMFIFDGIHVTQDIPNALKEIKLKHPGLNLNMSTHIGDDDRLADIITDRALALP